MFTQHPLYKKLLIPCSFCANFGRVEFLTKFADTVSESSSFNQDSNFIS